ESGGSCSRSLVRGGPSRCPPWSSRSSGSRSYRGRKRRRSRVRSGFLFGPRALGGGFGLPVPGGAQSSVTARDSSRRGGVRRWPLSRKLKGRKKTKMSKIRRKVTVENAKTISDSTSRRPSVFERLGPSTGMSTETHCRNWQNTGVCGFGKTCRYIHGPSPRGKGFTGSYRRSPERPTGDLRERMKNKRQEIETEPPKRSTEDPASPVRKESSRGRHREKDDIKITKERTPDSEEENADWETQRDDSDIGDVNYDYDHELSLELKRQKIQRELMKLEQENMEKREEIIINKEISPEVLRSKRTPSPSPRKSSKSPKRKLSPKASSSKKEKKASIVSSPLSDHQRSSKGSQSKKKGPRTPSPPPPSLEEILVVKKHKEKHKSKDRAEEKIKEGKEKLRDLEKHKDKKEKLRDHSEGSRRQKRSPSPADHSGSNSSHSREYSPPSARRRPVSPVPAKSTVQKHSFSQSRSRSVSPSGPHHSPVSSRHQSPSSQSGSSEQHHSVSPRRKRTPSPSYQRAASPLARCSASPYSARTSTSPHKKLRSPSKNRSPVREKARADRERTTVSRERRHERRD
ncbi:hypothetical protein NDU88_002911, partial [Pleurodeles waltl]